MIVVVTPNPALDVTYRLGGGLRVGQANRVVAVAERAGGKGVNVARVLACFGVPVIALGLLGGAVGEAVRSGLDAAGVAHDFTPIVGCTRRTVVVVAAADADGSAVSGPGSGDPMPPGATPGARETRGSAEATGSVDTIGLEDAAGSVEATGLWEPGPVVSEAEWAALRDRVRAHLGGASVLVLAGSLPPGAPVTGYAELVALAHAAGVPVVLDADGDALRHGLSARPTAAKPNAAELTALTGHRVTDIESATASVHALGTAAVSAAGPDRRTDMVVSLGPAGLLAVTSAGTWSARPPVAYPGNATGAGDAAVAALALGLRDGEPWPARLTRMIAWSAAAAAHPVAGELDPTLAAGLHATVIVSGCESP